MGRDGYVNWDGSWYGVSWTWAGQIVQVGVRAGMVEIWSGDERLAVHPRAHTRRQRLTMPGQWDGLVNGDAGPRREALAVQVSSEQVERRSLDVYERGRRRCAMIALEQARAHLETLGLNQAVEVLDSRLDDAARRQLPYPEMLADLLGVEVAARRERYLTTRTRMAKLPFQRTLDDFDFSFQPSIDERQMKELATLAFVSEATNILLLGPPGVGKTHLAVALALKSIENGQGAYFVRAYDLMEDLRKARAEHRLDRRMRVYLAPKVLVVDEFGIWPYDRESATAFFSLVSARYERGSIILTSNKGFADWGELLGDTVIATAILDRLLHHSYVLNIRGESYRLKDKRQSGLLTSQQLLNAGSEVNKDTT